MMGDNKTHYRKVFKSDYLGVADLEDFQEEGRQLLFTISHVKQQYDISVAGRQGNFNIAYFAEKIKPLVLNAHNSKILKEMASSPFVEDWVNLTIQLYIDQSVKMKGEVVGGVRIRPGKMTKNKPELTPQKKVPWENAITAYIRDGNLDAVKKRMNISEQNEMKLIEEAKNVA